MKNNFTVIGIGEILWDLLPDGKVLGGAPANFAYHANELDVFGIPVSAVGEDDLGDEILLELDKRGISSKYIQRDKYHSTGVVKVNFIYDEPHYIIEENSAWDNLQLTDELLDLFKIADAVCFGTLAQRSANNQAVINKLLRELKSSCIVYFDLNLRQNYYSKKLIDSLLEQSNIFKLNDNELKYISDFYGLNGSDLEKCNSLVKKFNLRLIALTLGGKGSLLVTNDGASRISPKIIQIQDTIGAGDSFSAAVVVGLLKHLNLESINEFANEVASYVCSQKGATPALPLKLKHWTQKKSLRLES